jgi:nicotinamidase/pyrazinamidase
MSIKITARDLLLVIDAQNDFCPGGALPVPDGDAIVSVINSLAAHFSHVVLTQDWHPADHLSFVSNYPGKKPFETITVQYGEQILWPEHCIQGGEGAAFHKDLRVSAELILRKGFHPGIDSYSAFQENDRVTKTGLAGYLRERGLQRIFLVGLAYDFCVRYSAVDARAAGFAAIVVEDACRSINLGDSVEQTRREFAAVGVECAVSGDID